MKKTTDQLVLELGVILDQIKACQRGLKDHPNDEVFKAALPYMIAKGKELKLQIEKQIKNEQSKS